MASIAGSGFGDGDGGVVRMMGLYWMFVKQPHVWSISCWSSLFAVASWIYYTKKEKMIPISSFNSSGMEGGGGGNFHRRLFSLSIARNWNKHKVPSQPLIPQRFD